MIKFHSLTDKKLFLRELSENALATSIDASFKPSDEQVALMKSNRLLKYFRKPCKNFRDTNYATSRGVKVFKKAVSNKKFNTSMATFLVQADAAIPTSLDDKFKLIQVLTSISTHVLIENQYYHTLLEHEELKNLTVCVIVELQAISNKLLICERLDAFQLNLLFRLTSTKALIKAFAEKYNEPIDGISILWEATKGSLVKIGKREVNDDFYTQLLANLKDSLKID